MGARSTTGRCSSGMTPAPTGGVLAAATDAADAAALGVARRRSGLDTMLMALSLASSLLLPPPLACVPAPTCTTAVNGGAAMIARMAATSGNHHDRMVSICAAECRLCVLRWHCASPDRVAAIQH